MKLPGLPVPETREHWESMARQNNVPITQLFSECSALPSGSKFTMKHYLPLRILVVDERSFVKKKRENHRAQYLRAETRRKVTTTMKADKSLQAVQKFLTSGDKIRTQWNAKHYRAVGPFGNGLEKLYQIVSWKSLPNTEPEDSAEDTTNLKLFASMPSPTPVPVFNPRLSAAFQSLNINRSPRTPPPQGRPKRNQAQADYVIWDDGSEFGESPGTEISSAPGTDKRQAVLDFEKTTLVLSDEQVVNMCLENLLMALSNVMGFYGRLVSERRAFIVPKDNTSNLYQACVDGLIMAPNREDVMAFIEVKRRLRSANDSVYRQIGAQMAAFIYNYDHQVNKNSSEEEERSMWMVSMEGYQAYIFIAIYDQAYVDYLSSKPGSENYSEYLKLVASHPYDLRVWPGKMESFFKDVATLMGGPKEK